MSRHTVLIADDHAIVRDGLKRMLGNEPDLEVIAEAAHGVELLALLAQRRPDVLLLDIAMPGLSGIDLIHRLQHLHSDLPILVLSMHNEGQIVTRALREGARGYVTKDADPALLATAIRRVASGGHYIDPSLVDSVVFQGTPDLGRHEQLSAREQQVLQRLVAGIPLGRIADELHLSPKTVSTHKMRLMQKLGVQSNADLLKYAMRHGLTS